MSNESDEDIPLDTLARAVTQDNSGALRDQRERRPALVFLGGELLAVPIPLDRDEVILGRAL